MGAIPTFLALRGGSMSVEVVRWLPKAGFFLSTPVGTQRACPLEPTACFLNRGFTCNLRVRRPYGASGPPAASWARSSPSGSGSPRPSSSRGRECTPYRSRSQSCTAPRPCDHLLRDRTLPRAGPGGDSSCCWPGRCSRWRRR